MKQTSWRRSATALALSGMLFCGVWPAVAAGADKPAAKTKEALNMDIGVLVQGSVLVPLRDLTDVLSAKLTWEAATKSITLDKDGSTVKLTIGDHDVQVNGKGKTLETAPQILDEKTFVPLRFVTEAFGASVSWNAEKKYAEVVTKDKELYISTHPYYEWEGTGFVYEGETKNGLPHGQGQAVRGTSIYGDIWYQGAWNEGKPTGLQKNSSASEDSPPAGAQGYQIYVNGSYLQSDFAPIVRNNAVHVPLWSLLGKLKISAESVDGILRINLPQRILLIRSDSSLMTYYGRGMDEHGARLEYPPISEQDVIYVPVAFLTEYMDMKAAWGDNHRIDLTAADLSKDASWGKDAVIAKGIKQLALDTGAENIWKEYPKLWAATLPYAGHDFSGPQFHEFEPLTVISYNGAKVTLSNGKQEITYTFSSLDQLIDSFYIRDPLNDFNWSESIKSLIREGKVKIGMTREQAELAWGKPNKINEMKTVLGVSEQWVYRGLGIGNDSYLYFTNGLLETIQK
ncbi:copper amine oxidase N-terminal domain-containing protein [Paenibacillus filicis]|uniref:Copper amine oxidase N-terminal domain-containing protein n=1 Tax=Paenibacillus filicis TaxID=669464 RepID=A0ABU9DKE4_9BACL